MSLIFCKISDILTESTTTTEKVNKGKIYIMSQVGIWRIVAVLMLFLSSFPERHGNTHSLVDSEKTKGKDQHLQRAAPF